MQNAVGAVPGPFDCFLVHRGLRTLHLRMEAHARSAAGGRRAAARDPGRRAMCAGRASAAWSASATRGRPSIAARTRLFTLAESLGGVESLIEVPQAMTHQSVEGSAAAVPPDLVRLSCGVEDPRDLVADLRAALGARAVLMGASLRGGQVAARAACFSSAEARARSVRGLTRWPAITQVCPPWRHVISCAPWVCCSQ